MTMSAHQTPTSFDDNSKEETSKYATWRISLFMLDLKSQGQSPKNDRRLRHGTQSTTSDWHMRNPEKNPQLNKPRDLWHLLKIGWIKLTEVTAFWKSTHYRAAMECEQRSGDSPSGRWVDAPASELPTPEERVRRRMAWLPQREDDLPETMFFGYDPAPELQTNEVQQPKAKRRRTLGFPLWRKKSLERTSSRTNQAPMVL